MNHLLARLLAYLNAFVALMIIIGGTLAGWRLSKTEGWSDDAIIGGFIVSTVVAVVLHGVIATLVDVHRLMEQIHRLLEQVHSECQAIRRRNDEPDLTLDEDLDTSS